MSVNISDIRNIAMELYWEREQQLKEGGVEGDDLRYAMFNLPIEWIADDLCRVLDMDEKDINQWTAALISLDEVRFTLYIE